MSLTTLLIIGLSVLVTAICVVSIVMSTTQGAAWTETAWRRLRRRGPGP